MGATRRLSLTLLLVAPLVFAQESLDDPPTATDQGQQGGSLGSAVSGEHLPKRRGGDHGDMDEEEDRDVSWSRSRRDLHVPGEVMDTAEQVLFRPIFRHRQLVEEREQRKKLRQRLDQQFQVVPETLSAAAPPGVSGPPVQQPPQRRVYVNRPYPYKPYHPAGTYYATPGGAVFIRPQRSIYPIPYQRH